jgi:hypothetical protein
MGAIFMIYLIKLNGITEAQPKGDGYITNRRMLGTFLVVHKEVMKPLQEHPEHRPQTDLHCHQMTSYIFFFCLSLDFAITVKCII